MKTDPVINPAIVIKTPNAAIKGDNAEAKSFMNHKNGAGQRNLCKSRMLMIAAKQLTTAASI